MQRQRRPMMGLGIFLLANRLFSTGFNHIPPITLMSILGQAALYMGVISPLWDRYDVCLSGQAILVYKEYRNLFLSAIEHADDFHLYYNMASFLIKGRSLEKRMGSQRFAILLLCFILSTGGIYVGLAKLAFEYSEDYSYMKQCAIGFSGVLFALKVLTSFEGEDSYIHGFLVPSKYVVWVELLLIQLLVPRASFMGHLAGILAGLLYLKGPMYGVVDIIDGLISGMTGREYYAYGYQQRNTYTYSRGRPRPTHVPPTASYGWNTDQEQHFEQPSQEELRRRRTQRFGY